MLVSRGWEIVPVVALGTALLLGAACGGGAQEAKTGGTSSDGNGSDTYDYQDGETAADGYCLDGTCFDCGETFCMPGWYCDESMAGGPGCSWIPECGSESSCGCVESALGSDCSCAEREGGIYVRCN